jgi:hypothetical protein
MVEVGPNITAVAVKKVRISAHYTHPSRIGVMKVHDVILLPVDVRVDLPPFPESTRGHQNLAPNALFGALAG